ncbi:transketolase-like TK C-terminal-containing protein [Nisaea sp.]|uniref:transketolase-like TK C-terminal-containing protein n=1 Tax=Nisaea sp. TaxID=2024842 RepID=UPI003B52E025
MGLLEPQDKIETLRELEKKVLWLAMWMIHNANHVRPSRDGIKVGGHQASCASVATLMTALYFDVLKPQDRVAVKPHASPIFHAIQYMMGRQDQSALERFRALGGAQSYPSRTKDRDEVDFSTGSVGLGVAMTLFASMVQDYVRLHHLIQDQGLQQQPAGRMIAVMGDAELDEGNIYEAMLEGWKYDVRNVWWVIDYNRQSLDGVVSDGLFQKIRQFFGTVDWNVNMLKYGKKLQRVFEMPGGDVLENWIDECPNDLYSALTFKGQSGADTTWRDHLKKDLRGVKGIKAILDEHDDHALHELMTNLAGHDMESVLESFHGVKDDSPQCFIAYTVKGFNTPLAGHKDNHAGLMTPEQMEMFRSGMGVPEGGEWDPFAHLSIPKEEVRDYVAGVSFNRGGSRVHQADRVELPDSLATKKQTRTSTQQAFGAVLNELARGNSALASRLVTTSPDVTVSTNLGPWVNQRGIFSLDMRNDVFRDEKVASAQKWLRHGGGQHFELGIAESNLFIMLGALGLSGPLFGTRLLPVGTLYDPFIQRGLDSLNYACYQDARFMVVATPSGISLAPEGGAHQSVSTPLIGMGQPGLTSFEPTYADELAEIMRWSFAHMQADDGGAVYLRLSTRPLEQPEREITDDLRDDIVSGGYWLREPAEDAPAVIVFTGAVVPEVLQACEMLEEELPGVGVLAVTSADRLYSGWQSRIRRPEAPKSHLEKLMGDLGPDVRIVTVQDGHPANLSWIGSALGRRLFPLGVTGFGQSGDLPDLYQTHGIDAEAIMDAVAAACVDTARGTPMAV